MALRKVRKVIHYPRRLLWAFVAEGIETRKMVRTFAKQGKGWLQMGETKDKPTEAEIQQAVEQFKDIPRFLPFLVFIIFPVPGMTQGYVLLAMTLEKYLGQKVSLLPSQFRNIFKKEEKEVANES
ncbi:MAG: hypothetical protein R2830_11710 [Saprospiraceae bacterium]|nr:hypothetical protein [Saprospiraceae bacterium]